VSLARTYRVLAGSVGATLALLSAAALLGTPPAGAQGAPPKELVVRRIDSSKMPAVTVVVSSGAARLDPQSITLTENGRPANNLRAGTLSGVKLPIGTVLAVDTSSSMSGAKISAVQSALKSFIAGKAAGEQMAVVAYGSTPRVVQDFTGDPARLLGAVNRLDIAGTPSLYAGIRTASNLLISRPDLLPQMVIVGDSGNAGQLATLDGATGDLLASKAVTYAVGLKFVPADTAGLARFGQMGRGGYREATDVAGTAQAFAGIRQELNNQYELAFDSRLVKGTADLVITAPGYTGSAQLIPGGVAQGAAVNPAPVKLVQAPGPLRGRFGLLLIALLVLMAAGMAVYAIAALITREDSSLAQLLRTYEHKDKKKQIDQDAEGSLIQTALVQRAVATTARLAQERGLLEKVEAKLEQADLALRPAEALFFWLASGAVLTVAALFLKGPFMALIALGAAVLLPPAVLSFMAARRLKRFNSELPDTLQLLSSSLRAGFSFLQGVEAVAHESQEPMASELRRVIVEAQLGRPIEEALQDCAARMKSPDFDWAVMAVGIQREVGGNLADLLQTVAVTMVERERLRRDVKSLTAEGRMSAIVLGIMPPALGLVFYVTNPAYIRTLFVNPGGQIALAIAVVSMLAGFAWMKKIVDIKV